MDCRSVSAAERVCDCDEGVQCPNERKPIFLMQAIYGYPSPFATVDVPDVAVGNPRRSLRRLAVTSYRRNRRTASAFEAPHQTSGFGGCLD